MARKLSSLGAVLIALLANAAWAQDALLEDLYGRGVHAFFAQRIPDAFNALNAAIASGSRDPRAYYFRGLTLNRLGRPDEARDDFRKGAELEILGGEPYPVGRSLERVQGSDRALLESQRTAMRLAIHNTQAARDRARYEEAKRAEAEALRATGRPAAVVVPAAPVPVVVPPDATNPFGPAVPVAPPAALPPSTPEATPIPPAVPSAEAPAAVDPFAAPIAPATRPLPAEAPPEPAPAPPPRRPAPSVTPAEPADPFADVPNTAAPAPATPAPVPASPVPPGRPVPVPAAPVPAAPAADPFGDLPPAVPSAATPAPATPAPATPAPTPPAPAPAPPAPAPPPPAADDPFATPPPAPAPVPAAPTP